MFIPKILKNRIEKENDFYKTERSEDELKLLISTLVTRGWEEDILSFVKNRTMSQRADIKDLLLSLEEIKENTIKTDEDHCIKPDSSSLYFDSVYTYPDEICGDEYVYTLPIIMGNYPLAVDSDDDSKVLGVG